MTVNKELSKDERVKKEIFRLNGIFKDLPKDIYLVVEGLIVEAAELRIRLEDIRKDLDTNGYDEMFSQSDTQEPYERERPQARRYVALNKSYQSIMRQLIDHLPKASNFDEEDYQFEKFLARRG